MVMHCLKKFASLKYFDYIVLVFILEVLSAESDLFFDVCEVILVLKICIS